jgi:hypothetical protein
MKTTSFLAFACALVLAACGGKAKTVSTTPGDNTPPGSMTPTPMPAPATGVHVSAQDIADRTFDFDDLVVFGIRDSVELTFGVISGTPPSGTFSIQSNSNDDEAHGTLTPCTFAITTSTFRGNTVLVSGATIMLDCDIDAGALRLSSPNATNTSESTGCSSGPNGMPCVFSSH